MPSGGVVLGSVKGANFHGRDLLLTACLRRDSRGTWGNAPLCAGWWPGRARLDPLRPQSPLRLDCGLRWSTRARAGQDVYVSLQAALVGNGLHTGRQPKLERSRQNARPGSIRLPVRPGGRRPPVVHPRRPRRGRERDPFGRAKVRRVRGRARRSDPGRTSLRSPSTIALLIARGDVRVAKGVACKPLAQPTQVRILLPPLGRKLAYNADVAQLVEHLHGKEGVRGSSPRVGSPRKPLEQWRDFETRVSVDREGLTLDSGSFRTDSHERPRNARRTAEDWRCLDTPIPVDLWRSS